MARVVGGLNIPPAILQAHLLLLDINEISPPGSIQIRIELAPFIIRGVSGWLGWLTYPQPYHMLEYFKLH